MKIAIAADHGGFELKQKLIAHYSSLGVEMNDLGTYSAESVDYPDYARKSEPGRFWTVLPIQAF